MRPKKSKSNVNNASEETVSFKEDNSPQSQIHNVEDGAKIGRTTRNNKNIVKSLITKAFLKTALKVDEIKNETQLEVNAIAEKVGNKTNENEMAKPEIKCTYCSKGFKSNASRRRHEKNSCKQNPQGNERSPKSSGKVTDVNNGIGEDIAPKKLTSSISNGPTTTTFEAQEGAKISKNEIIVASPQKLQGSTEDSDPLILTCHSDDKEYVNDRETIRDDEKPNEGRIIPVHMCKYCNKVCKTDMGLRRHLINCKKKPSNDRSASPLLAVDNQNMSSFESPKICPATRSENGDDKLVITNKNKCDCCEEDLETAHITGDFKCDECSKLFRLKSSLERHIRVIHFGESHNCPQCGAKCPDKGTLARHMYTHTGLKPYSCPVCKQEFSRKYHLARHNMQTGCDGKEKPIFPCQVCGREFNRKDNLREHLRAHAGQTKRKKKFTCDCCGVDYEANELLKLHKKDHLDKQYTCEYCSKIFSSSGAMKKHRRTHTGEKPYECGTCRKRFAAKETLNRHVRIHTGYKPHNCQLCGKSFIQSSQLKSHMFYHSGQTVLQDGDTHVCDLCGKKFNRRARLNEHVKYMHLGAKPFGCHLCDKTFIRKEDLNRHIVIHSGLKPHQCPICSKSFAMKSTLKVHLLTHTKEPPKSCDECGRAFIRQDCLLRHMKNKHREMLEEIKTEAEKKKLQQQLLQVAAEASLVEGMEEQKELDENGLVEAVRELLTLLVDETTLKGLGWPGAGVEAILEAVIKLCGHEPAPSSTPRHDRLRHNIKLLFTVVIDDSAVKALLNNQTVDEVILHVLRLAKS